MTHFDKPGNAKKSLYISIHHQISITNENQWGSCSYGYGLKFGATRVKV